ncbi:MAG: glycosyltransferase [Gemmatimonadota bacterium]|jgi:UDP-N-acetylglucosamine transferase subunit ALG13
MRTNGLRVLFAVHDWGLGHATRDLVLIRALLAEGHRVTVLSHGRALRLLEGELDSRCEFVALRDIPKPLSRRPFWFYVRMSLALPSVFYTFHRERRLVRQLHDAQPLDCIVSDSRFGVWLSDVPSLQLFHSLRQIIPGRPRGLEKLVECAQRRMLGGADRILIPDASHDGLAGDLSHDPHCDWGGRLEYIGPLASIRRRDVDQDIDFFISVSGAEPQRTIFERLVLEQAHDLPGRVVVALGRPDGAPVIREDGRITVHSYLNRERQEDIMNRAALVVTRSGYSTLMELAELGRKALLVPTPGQSEQEYLARYHEARGHLHAVRQAELNLARDVRIAAGYAGLPPLPSAQESVQRFMDVLARATGAVSQALSRRRAASGRRA